jgi:hypothetical protein
MKAAGLIDIDTVVSSTAVLVKSKNPTNPALVSLIASRIKGVISKSAFQTPNSVPYHLLATRFVYFLFYLLTYIAQLPKSLSFVNTTLSERSSLKQPKSLLESEQPLSMPSR